MASGPTVPRRIGPILAEQLSFIESGRRTRAEIQAAFRAITDVIEENITYAESVGADAHYALAQAEKTRATVFALRARYFRKYERERKFIVPGTRPMALWEIAKLVYGDATKVSLLYQVNSFPDLMAVPPGSSVTILPSD
jgi:hypothetical protein